MKTILILISLVLLLTWNSCVIDPAATGNPIDGIIFPRACVGDHTIHYLEKGKCKNDCTRGHSIHCGGHTEKYECGKVQVIIGSCDDSFSQPGDWEDMPTMSSQDTADAVSIRMDYTDRYHARFVFLKDVSDELAVDSLFTITNNVRWVDYNGNTFGGLTTYHYFQFVGGDYPIVVSQAYPYGAALINMVTY
jgi:hypothetical protein